MTKISVDSNSKSSAAFVCPSTGSGQAEAIIKIIMVSLSTTPSRRRGIIYDLKMELLNVKEKEKSMKKLLLAIMVSFFAVSAYAADVGVSVSIGQPGFYGQIDIGNAPRPEFINPRPVIIQPAPVYVNQEPLYLRVPPGHQKKWSKHCAKYNACGRPVYFVKDKWYNKVYVPHYRAHQEEYARRGHGPKDGGKHGDKRGHDQKEKHDNGQGHGKGHWKD